MPGSRCGAHIVADARMPVGFTAAVLAGGAGTRLKTALSDRPKALAPIHGTPFLFILLDQLLDAGAERIVICTGHLGSHIQQAVGSRHRNCPVLYSHEDTPLGTGGALRKALDCCDANLWLVTNGDSYIDTPLAGYVSWHQQAERNGSILLAWVEDASRFGTVELSADGRVAAFQEKRGLAVPGWINGGIYLLPRRRIEQLPAGCSLSLEYSVLPRWANEGLPAYCVRAPFIDIGTPESLMEAAQFFRFRSSAAEGRQTVWKEME